MKNVILDFNSIIRAEYDNSLKTGIYYTQYNIIKELLKNHKNEFNFFAFSYYSRKTFYEVINNKLPEFKDVKYFEMFSKTEMINNFFKNKIGILRRKKKSSKNLFLNSTLVFGILSLKFVKLLIPKFKSKKLFKNIDIYQSFYDDIPEKIEEYSNAKKFIIVHDILPITNPEFFTYEKDSFRNKIDKIDVDTIIFTDSAYTKKELLELFPKFKKENVIVNLLAADSNRYYKINDINLKEKNEILTKYNIPTNDKYILSLCSLNKRKNLAFLIEGFVNFLEKNSDVKNLNLVLAGPKGWLMDEMFNSISNAEKHKDKIILTGFVDDKDINMIYNSAFMFVFPSFAEGFGLPVLEAMQCGIPVISSNTTSLPEVYGDAAIGINPTNMEELEKAIHEIYFNNDIRNKLIEDGLKQSKNFSWKKTVDNIIKEYIK